ncbi:uncharacterized protein LOC107640976 [Arachis ipaensis]|uniref:uncharacterized protein LOC107640976 n=1 Tax=Arachis ipaensis TaxID=130454 RepID=UPI0007AF6221|nr:uncharacterized protein LOC107640976 [Arachis ipaensis]XP_025652949.1 uncharacterized protein LOC112748906 [Arachis hypogaea]
MEAEAELKKELTPEKLKEIKAQEETESVTMHVPMRMEEPKDQPSPDVQEEPKEEQLARFLAILRKLQVNISITEALEKKPPYMSDKPQFDETTALKEDERVILIKECSTLIQKKLPLKMPYPRSFLIPCTIGTITFEKTLCDLGSSINLMPLSVMKKLRIQEVLSTRISLEMADMSLKRTNDMVENVLVKVDDLFLPADFVILDTGEDRDDSIILGRTFLATEMALIDVEKGELVLRLNGDHILFKIPNPHSSSDKGGTTVHHLVFQPSLSVESITEPPNIKSKFGVRHPSPSTEEGGRIGIAGDTLIEMDKPITKRRMEHVREPTHRPQHEPVQSPPPEIPEMPQRMHFSPHDY